MNISKKKYLTSFQEESGRYFMSKISTCIYNISKIKSFIIYVIL